MPIKNGLKFFGEREGLFFKKASRIYPYINILFC